MDFSYPFGDSSNKKTPDGPWRYIWSHLTYDLKKVFYNTLEKEVIILQSVLDLRLMSGFLFLHIILNYWIVESLENKIKCQKNYSLLVTKKIQRWNILPVRCVVMKFLKINVKMAYVETA